MDQEASILLLGDHSGSMSVDGRMNILKKTMRELTPVAVKNCKKVALAVWDHEYERFGGDNGWVTDSKLTNALSWIEELKSKGGTSLGQAIVGCLRDLGHSQSNQQVTDVYVMTDGDMHDFPNVDEWQPFRGKYGEITFHFIAIGDANSPLLEQMARIGHGNYHELFDQPSDSSTVTC